MLHLVLYVLLAIIVAVGLFLLASRFLPAGEQIAPAIRDEPVWELPDERGLQAEDVDGVRLPVALRGYRFAETDVLLDRLAAELRARDAEIARLRGERRPTPNRGTRDDRTTDQTADQTTADTADRTSTHAATSTDAAAPPPAEHDPDDTAEHAANHDADHHTQHDADEPSHDRP